MSRSSLSSPSAPAIASGQNAGWDSARFTAQTLSSAAHLAAVLDHTLLKPDATRAHVLQLCHEAAEHRFACAMVNPTWVATAVVALAGTGIPVGVVIGFPLGTNLSASKQDEAARVLALGAHDVDMVLNIGLLKSGTPADFDSLRHEIRSVVELAHDAGAIVKVILETCLLSFEEKLRAADLTLAAGADFLKTADDIALLREQAGSRAGIKASGGIRSLAYATTMLRAGASRIGASASVRILTELTGPAASPGIPSGY